MRTRRLYLLGFVGFVSRDGVGNGEITLTRSGGWTSLWPRTVDEETHVWATREQAAKAARKQLDGKHPVFTRGYWLESSNPQPLPEMTDKDFEVVPVSR